MRTLKALVEENENVWIYCKDEPLQVRFLEQLEEEGFLALNGQKPTELFHHQLYGINDDMTMGYLAVMIWWMTFKDEDTHIRVDYEKYISGEEDYFCHTPHLEKVGQTEWKKLP